ncbi:MAG: ATP-binding protein [Ectothiorhodospira sp.]
MQGRIRYRILALALLPTLAVALALTVYWTGVKVRELDAQMMERGHMLVAFLAPAAEYGVISGNRAYLEAVTTKARAQPDVVEVSIRDRQGNLLYTHHHQPQEPYGKAAILPWIAARLFDEEERHFREPITLTALDEHDLPLPESMEGGEEEDSRLLGSVSVSLTNLPTLVHQIQWVLQSLGLILVIVLMTWLVVLRWSLGLSRPLEKIAATVRHIGRGDLSARSRARVSGELGLLQRGINDMAESIERSQRSMVERVNKATRSLQEKLAEIDEKNRALNRARAEADLANRRKSQFLASISHELRTPLTAIRGYTELLLMRDDLDEQPRTWIAIIEESSQDTLKLVNDLLDISRIESGNLPLEHADFDLEQLVAEVVRVCRKGATHQAVDVNVFIDPGMPYRMISDPMRITQVITNILSNAVKFTRNGQVIMRLGIRTSAPALRLEMEVQDFGPGIPEDQREPIFEPFYQVKQEDGRGGTGSGLGLSITRGLLQVLHGEIHVESSPGRGSTFHLNLPVEPADDPARPASPLTVDAVFLLVDEDEARAACGHCLDVLEIRHSPCSTLPALLQALDEETGPCRALIWTRHADPGLESLLRAHAHRIPQLILVAFAHLPEELTTALRRLGAVLMPPPVSLRSLEAHLHRSLYPQGDPSLQKTDSVPKDPPGIHGWRILIADDNAVNRRLLETFIHRAGGIVDLAADGQEAVERYREAPCDAVLMDVHMPVLNGPDALRAIRREDPGAFVIALTADARPEFRESLLEMGFDRVLTKPVTQAQLQAVILDTPHEGLARPPDHGAEGRDRLHDPEQAVQAAGGSPELAEELRLLLVKDLQAAHEALQDPDMPQEALLELAHRLKGAARYCAVQRLEQAASRLENTLRSGGGEVEALRTDLLAEVRLLLQVWDDEFNPS